MGLMITFKQYIVENKLPTAYDYWGVVNDQTEPFFKKSFRQFVDKNLNKAAIPYFLNYSRYTEFNRLTKHILHNSEINEGKYLPNEQAYQILQTCFYSIYKHDYKHWVNHFTYNEKNKRVASFNGTKFSATRLRNLVLKEIFEYISKDYKTFLRESDWLVIKKQQQIKDAISKKDKSGWDL